MDLKKRNHIFDLSPTVLALPYVSPKDGTGILVFNLDYSTQWF